MPEKPEIPQPNFLERRRAPFQAYYESMPLRRTPVPRGIDLQLYRRVRWGRLITFHMLDTRQYRDDQACGRTITGAEQERWLLDGLRRSDARWDILGQQVFFAQRDTLDGPDKRLSMDAWDGYSANRDRVTTGLATNATVTLNPHVRFYNNQRGCVRTTITPDLLTADVRVVPKVTTPGSAAHTRATFVVEDRVPGVRQTYDRPLDPPVGS